MKLLVAIAGIGLVAAGPLFAQAPAAKHTIPQVCTN